jgi:hypothetical protein
LRNLAGTIFSASCAHTVEHSGVSSTGEQADTTGIPAAVEATRRAVHGKDIGPRVAMGEYVIK